MHEQDAAAGQALPDLVIFDCDGVLVDSETISNRILTEHLCGLGLDYTFERTVRSFMGRSMASCLQDIEAELGRALPENFEARLQGDTFAALERDLQPVPGVREALEHLAHLGVRTCVASSGAHEKMRLTLGTTGLLQYFGDREGRVFSATEVERGKPHPDLFLHAAAGMNVPPERCVVVEDSLPGVRAAVAAGMTVFGYAGGHAGAHLADAGATVFDDMRALPRLLGATAAGTP